MKLPLIIALCAGLILSGAAQAGEIRISQKFSGVAGHPNLALAVVGYAENVSFQLKGSPGNATMLALGEFEAFTGLSPAPCPASFPLGSELVHESFVETFSDGSMLLFEAISGRKCLDANATEFIVQLSGLVVGGTGRFEGASGTWTMLAGGLFVTSSWFQSALTGTLEATIEN